MYIWKKIIFADDFKEPSYKVTPNLKDTAQWIIHIQATNILREYK